MDPYLLGDPFTGETCLFGVLTILKKIYLFGIVTILKRIWLIWDSYYFEKYCLFGIVTILKKICLFEIVTILKKDFFIVYEVVTYLIFLKKIKIK